MKIATLPGVQVKLRVNGADLQEYADNTDELYTPKIGRQYVEAVSGADFEICFAVEYGAVVSHTQADVVACHIYLDGKWVTAQVLDTSSSAWAHGRADNGRGECRCSIDGRVENVGGLGGQYYKRRFGKPVEDTFSVDVVLIMCQYVQPLPTLRREQIADSSRMLH